MGLRKRWVRLLAVVTLVLVACAGNRSVHTHFVCHLDIGGIGPTLRVDTAQPTSAQSTFVAGSPLRGDKSVVRYRVDFSVLGTPAHRLAHIAVSVARPGDPNATAYGARAFDEGPFPFVGRVPVLAQYAEPVAYDCPRPT